MKYTCEDHLVMSPTANSLLVSGSYFTTGKPLCDVCRRMLLNMYTLSVDLMFATGVDMTWCVLKRSRFTLQDYNGLEN